MKNFYTLFTALCFACLLSARAQDTTVCNPGYYFTTNQHSVNFQAVDMHSGVIHSWSFGDGSFFTSPGSSANHTYGVAGYYTVRHIIRDSISGTCHDSATQLVRIDSVPACGISFSMFQDSSRLPNKFWFYAYPAVHGRDSLSWYVNGVLVSRADSVFYDTLPKGNYTVCVQLRSAGGCTASYCQYFTVDSADTTHTPPPPPPPHDSCSISFSYSVNASHPNEVHFVAHDSSGLDSLTWFITRGVDTAVLHGPAPVYVFSDSGCYSVLLYAVSPRGCYSWSGQPVCIDSLPGSTYIASYPNPAVGETRLDLKLDQDNAVYINVFNSMGHLVLSKRVAGIRGMNQVVLPTADLPKGVYYVQIQYGNVSKRSKIQKL